MAGKTTNGQKKHSYSRNLRVFFHFQPVCLKWDNCINYKVTIIMAAMLEERQKSNSRCQLAQNATLKSARTVNQK